MRTPLVAAGVLALLSGCRYAPPPAIEHIDWVLDPTSPGPDSPPSGRSLFDSLVPSSPPFPFQNLLSALESEIGSGVLTERVLIPLGRSLQRSAGAPDFFKYPRAVVAFNAEPSFGLLVKDRLFVAYHEKAAVLEVISYNDRAGRFEFQLVKDYREGATPRVLYARRKVCTSCHQNQAPLFPTQLWDETNANPAVSRLLLAEHREYYGFPVQQTADASNQIDRSVHRANEFSTYQLLWASASPAQRAALVEASLRCRASGACAPGEGLQSLAEDWRRQWPNGLAIPNPEIPARNPLAVLSREGPRDHAATLAFLAQRQMTVDPVFEPAKPRPPLDYWRGDDGRVEQLVRGLGAAYPEHDIGILKVAWREHGAKLVPSRLACVNEKVFRPAAILGEVITSISPGLESKGR